MVDVGAKASTQREAVAEAIVTMSADTQALLFGGALPKGDALAVARIAAIGATKKTSDLIPLCHPLALTAVEVDIDRHETGARIVVTARTTGQTGVEMEALTGAAVGSLTLYDMIKAVERGATIGPVRLLAKSGGASGDWQR